jgi:tRNA (adenine37-N6)-methyltransferase
VVSDQHADNTFVMKPIGRARTPWSKGHCPKNMPEARATGKGASLIIDAAWRDGLQGIDNATHLIVLGWFESVDRAVLIQHPVHLASPQGCFSLRSPARPNPIGVSVVRLVAVERAKGILELDALDWFNATQLLDIKPYFASTDCIADATVRRFGSHLSL